MKEDKTSPKQYGHFIDEKLIKLGFHSGRDKERKPQFHLIHPELVSPKPSFFFEGE